MSAISRPLLRALSAAALGWAVMSPSLADEVTLLTDDANRLLAHFEMARQARTDINVAYSFIYDDDVARAFFAELIDAARRGRTVRLLLDSYGSHLPREVVAYLRGKGVEVRFFHHVDPKAPRTWKSPSLLLQRMHDKLVESDGTKVLAGTSNMGEFYYHSLRGEKPVPRRPFRRQKLEFTRDAREHFFDRNFRIEGESTQAFRDYFMAVWNGPEVRPPTALPELSPSEIARQDVLTRGAQKRFASLKSDVTPFRMEIPASDIGFVSTLADKGGEGEGLAASLLDDLARATQHVVIETPYLLPDDPFVAQLKAAVKVGVPVTILTNSGTTNNHGAANHVYEPAARELRKAGAAVKVWTEDSTMHPKTVAIDGEKIYLLTANLNRRSFGVDSEIGFWVRNPLFSAKVIESARIESYEPLRAGGVLLRCLQGVLSFIATPIKGQL